MDSNKAHYIVVTGIVLKDGKYLIVKRASHEKVWPNRWTVPGGKLELDDYSKRKKDTSDHWYNVCETVLRREIKEETNLEVKNIGYITSLAFVRPDNIPTLVISLFAHYKNGEIKLSEDMGDYAWVTLGEAKNYDLIPGIYEEIEMLDKYLKGKKMGEWKKN